MTEDLDMIIRKLQQLPNKADCLSRVYQILTKKYYGNKTKTYLRLLEILSRDISDIWSKDGFIHCTNLNYLAKNMLVRSGHFRDEDIQLKWTLIYWISPHQYMKVRTSENEYVNVDIWAHAYGIKFGNYAHGFNI